MLPLALADIGLFGKPAAGQCDRPHSQGECQAPLPSKDKSILQFSLTMQLASNVQSIAAGALSSSNSSFSCVPVPSSPTITDELNNYLISARTISNEVSARRDFAAAAINRNATGVAYCGSVILEALETCLSRLSASIKYFRFPGVGLLAAFEMFRNPDVMASWEEEMSAAAREPTPARRKAKAVLAYAKRIRLAVHAFLATTSATAISHSLITYIAEYLANSECWLDMSQCPTFVRQGLTAGSYAAFFKFLYQVVTWAIRKVQAVDPSSSCDPDHDHPLSVSSILDYILTAAGACFIGLQGLNSVATLWAGILAAWIQTWLIDSLRPKQLAQLSSWSLMWDGFLQAIGRGSPSISESELMLTLPRWVFLPISTGNGSSVELNLPEQFCCPITLQLPVQPVLLHGTLFEKAVIKNWVIQRGSHPCSRRVVCVDEIQEHPQLSQLIHQWARHHHGEIMGNRVE